MTAISEQTIPAPPRACIRPQRRQMHGVTLEDSYAWLRDANWREAMRDPRLLAPAIRSVLEAENAYTDAMMAPTAPLQKALVAQMRGRILEADASVPTRDGHWQYYVRYREGGEHPLFCRRAAGRDDDEQVLLDAEAQSRGRSYYKLAAVAHSNDHRWLAYSLDETGAEVYTLHLREIGSGEENHTPIPETAGSVVWSADSSTLFYTTLDEQHRPCRVWRLPLGAEPDAAELVYEEADPGFFVAIGETQSGRFILIDAHDHETGEVRLIDAAQPDSQPRLVAARATGVEYTVEDDGDRLVILTNADGAEDFKLATAALADPGRGNWRDLVAHEPGRLILDHIVYARHHVRMERVDALPRIVITAKDDGATHAIAFDEEVYALGVDPGLEYDTDTLRFIYSSPTRPDEVTDYDMATRTRELRKRRRIPSGHDPDAYTARRIFACAADGERVPVTLLHRRDLVTDAETPCLLYGYGAYGISEAAGFSGNRLSLVDRGFVFAIAHVRGGMECGYRWYREGKGAHKHNSFDDFIAVAEHLIATGTTGAGRIAPLGGSAGGLLVGAVLNRRPDLFGAAVADVPFVDVLNTMLDPELPLTPPEWPEWGNPLADADAFAAIRAYCPYQNVAAQAYPPLLVIAGVSDPRVTYWEPAKWVAKLRALKTDENLLLLKTHMDAGHGGMPGRFQALAETALIYAFVITALG